MQIGRVEVGKYTVTQCDILASGYGKCGTTFAAFDEKENKRAAQRIDVSQMKEATKTRLKEALKKSVKLNHPNILRILDFTETEDFLWVFMEICKLKHLKDYFEGQDISFYAVLDIMKQIVDEYEYLSANDVIHNNAHFESILVDDSHDLGIKLQSFSPGTFFEPELMSATPGTVSHGSAKTVDQGTGVMHGLGMLFLTVLQASGKKTNFVPRINRKIPTCNAKMSEKPVEPVSIAEIGQLLNDTTALRHNGFVKQLSEMIHKMTGDDPPSFDVLSSFLEEMKGFFEPVSYKFD